MPTIDIDFDVFKAITARRPFEHVSDNDVLRQVLGLPPRSRSGAPAQVPQAGDWVSKGVRFPEGTEFRARYKGETHLARVEAGALLLGGKRFDAPSPAAGAITGNNVDGWKFWEARRPGESSFRPIKAMRTG